MSLSIERVNEVVDYSRALPALERLNSPLVQTTIAVTDYLKMNGERKVEPSDAGATDANMGVALGFPSVAVGAVAGSGGHSLEESAEKASIIPGTKFLILLMSALAGVN